ncbi:hypothetical protein NUW54_g7062 [Trametes sanguinea]|uniref:Uncharacterized protein n=1 Tax=Trametes sanguinea TaxID=158606 RepID=A0ACC1PQN8_9APHY|nr:hypothetical protein NUW54_g7062 [Trametes sanguinea]
MFAGSGWAAYHPPPGSAELSSHAHYFYSSLPTSKFRVNIQVGAGDVGVYYVKEPVAEIGEGSAVECWVDDNYRGAVVIENAAEVGEPTPSLQMIDHRVSRRDALRRVPAAGRGGRPERAAIQDHRHLLDEYASGSELVGSERQRALPKATRTTSHNLTVDPDDVPVQIPSALPCRPASRQPYDTRVNVRCVSEHPGSVEVGGLVRVQVPFAGGFPEPGKTMAYDGTHTIDPAFRARTPARSLGLSVRHYSAKKPTSASDLVRKIRAECIFWRGAASGGRRRTSRSGHHWTPRSRRAPNVFKLSLDRDAFRVVELSDVLAGSWQSAGSRPIKRCAEKCIDQALLYDDTPIYRGSLHSADNRTRRHRPQLRKADPSEQTSRSSRRHSSPCMGLQDRLHLLPLYQNHNRETFVKRSYAAVAPGTRDKEVGGYARHHLNPYPSLLRSPIFAMQAPGNPPTAGLYQVGPYSLSCDGSTERDNSYLPLPPIRMERSIRGGVVCSSNRPRRPFTTLWYYLRSLWLYFCLFSSSLSSRWLWVPSLSTAPARLCRRSATCLCYPTSPFCASDGRAPPSASLRVDYPSLTQVQNALLDELVDHTSNGIELALNVKHAELAVRDLAGVVRASNMTVKEALVDSLGRFVVDAQATGQYLQRLSAKALGTIDSISAFNLYALQSINAGREKGGQHVDAILARTFETSMDSLASQIARTGSRVAGKDAWRTPRMRLVTLIIEWYGPLALSCGSEYRELTILVDAPDSSDPRPPILPTISHSVRLLIVRGVME